MRVYFFLCGRCHFSPRRGHFLHVVGLFFRMFWGGYFWSCPPLTIFLREPILLSHFFYITDIYFFPDRGGFNFLRELIFFFSWEGGGALREGGRLLSTFILFLREHAVPGVYNDSSVRNGNADHGRGWAEVIYFSWCWGGGRWGEFFWWIE